MTELTADVIVIGGGIAGLAAAYELQGRGASVRLLEAGSRTGGVICTERDGDWVIDGGPDSMLVQKAAAVSLCRELGIADRLVPTLTPRTAYVLRGERLHPLLDGSFLGFPLKAGALVRSSLFTVAGKLRMAAELFVPRAGSGEDESIASFVRRRFGDEAVDYLAEPLLAGIHAGDVERLSVRALFPRLVDAEAQTGSVIRAFRALHVKPAPNGAFVSLPGGIGELVDVLSAALAPGVIELAAPVTGIDHAGTYLVETPHGTLRSNAVVLAVPAYVAAHLLRGLDTTLAGLCSAVPYASTATVAFGYRADQVKAPMRGSGFVVPKAERKALLAGSWISSKWPHRAPPGHVLMRGFLGGGRDPHRLDKSDAELIDTARTALEEIMHIEGEPLFARLFRWTRQSPQYEVGHLQRLVAIDQHVAALPGLFVTGSGFRSIGIPDCIADGRDAGGRAHAFVTARGR